MIGDTVFDMAMARNARVRAVGVSWGYHERAELAAAGAHTVIDSFGELSTMIAGLLGDE
jgi:phosphoglycolate phosphatase